ncbi:hypothetical protein [Deefgea piscis]|uniref:hypothetical protein n=1 Tax=Deefgea piscis TaxID=2739061 RepID=UPI001C8132DD|nr:hypothetical protein [Deefgea piscis]QZA82553.1 hypothetical protein K4H25_07960 [Deefgea piscis]
MNYYEQLNYQFPKLSVTGSIPVGRTNQINDLAKNKHHKQHAKHVHSSRRKSNLYFFIYAPKRDSQTKYVTTTLAKSHFLAAHHPKDNPACISDASHNN